MSSPRAADIEAARDSIATLAQSLGARREGASGRTVKVGDTPKICFEIIFFIVVIPFPI